MWFVNFFGFFFLLKTLVGVSDGNLNPPPKNKKKELFVTENKNGFLRSKTSSSKGLSCILLLSCAPKFCSFMGLILELLCLFGSLSMFVVLELVTFLNFEICLSLRW